MVHRSMGTVLLVILLIFLVIVLYFGMCTFQIKQLGYYKVALGNPNAFPDQQALTAFQTYGLSGAVTLRLIVSLKMWIPFVQDPINQMKTLQW